MAIKKIFKEEDKDRYVLTLPLKTEPWQRDVLNKRFRVCASVYNALLGKMNRTYEDMCLNVPGYKEARILVEAGRKYDENDKDARTAAAEVRKTPEYKEAWKLVSAADKEHGFTKFGCEAEAIKMRDYFGDVIPTRLAQLSIGIPLWTGFEDFLYGTATACRFKKQDDFKSIVTDGKSGIRIVDEDGKTADMLTSNRRYRVLVTSKRGKNLDIPIVIDRYDDYVMDSMGKRICIARIVRKKLRSGFMYSLQLSLEGKPPVKYDHDGNEVNPVGKGKIGLFFTESHIAVAYEDGSAEEICIDNPRKPGVGAKLEFLQQKMDESRKVNNPDNFDSDGRPYGRKRLPEGIKRLQWVKSKTYQRYQSEKANIERKEAESRDINAFTYANMLLARGDDISVNKRTFKNSFGGKDYKEKIKNNSPASILGKLKSKMKSRGVGEIHEYFISIGENERKADGWRIEGARKVLLARLQELGEAP